MKSCKSLVFKAMLQNISKIYLCVITFSLHLFCRRSFANALWYIQYTYESHYLSETKNIKLNEFCSCYWSCHYRRVYQLKRSMNGRLDKNTQAGFFFISASHHYVATGQRGLVYTAKKRHSN